MTSRPMTIALHRAFDHKPLTIVVDHIRYFQAIIHDRAPLTKVALLTGDELVQESARDIQRLCVGC